MHSRGVKDNPATYKTALYAALKVLNKEEGLVHLFDVPTIIISDLHARRGMLIDILSKPIAQGPYE